MEVITGNGIPQSHLPFSPAIRAGGFVFVSGQASVDATGKIVAEKGSRRQDGRRPFVQWHGGERGTV